MSSVSNILDKAADLVESGWCQGKSFGYDKGRLCYCLTGAVQRATDLSPEGDTGTGRFMMVGAALETLCRVLETGTDERRYLKILEWNDHRDRTQAEVVAKLREAAEAQR